MSFASNLWCLGAPKLWLLLLHSRIFGSSACTHAHFTRAAALSHMPRTLSPLSVCVWCAIHFCLFLFLLNLWIFYIFFSFFLFFIYTPYFPFSSTLNLFPHPMRLVYIQIGAHGMPNAISHMPVLSLSSTQLCVHIGFQQQYHPKSYVVILIAYKFVLCCLYCFGCLRRQFGIKTPGWFTHSLCSAPGVVWRSDMPSHSCRYSIRRATRRYMILLSSSSAPLQGSDSPVAWNVYAITTHILWIRWRDRTSPHTHSSTRIPSMVRERELWRQTAEHEKEKKLIYI